jgi:hypothetical protein
MTRKELLFITLIFPLLVGVVSAETCKPICDKIGTRSEGWYDSCSGKLIKYDSCGRCEAVCKEIGTRSEGWYSSCDGSTIWLTTCEERAVCTDSDGANIYIKGTTTGWDYNKEIIISNSDSCTDYDGGAPKDSGQWVIEEQCDEEGRVHSYYYKCPAGYWCEEGRCVFNESLTDCPDYCENGWHYYGGKFNAETEKCDYSGKRFCKYGCDDEGMTCKIPENVSCPDYCSDGTFWKDGSFNEWTLECDYKYKIVCEQGCNDEGTACKSGESETKSEESEVPCEEKMRKVIEETCLNQGVDEEICKERYNNLVEFECKKKGQVEESVIELTICQSLRNKLVSLSEELIEAKSEEKKEKISAEISELKKEYEKCIKKPEETESEKTEINICEELENLKESYNNLLEKEMRMKELVSSGKVEKTALEEIQREKLFLEKRIEKAETSCMSTGSYHESPCLMLSTMMKVESVLNEKISTANKGEAEELSKKLKEVEEEIIRLREECASHKLVEERVNSLIEAEEVYKSKIQNIIERSSAKEIDDRLQEVEKEKDELISKLVEELNDIDLRNTGIVKEVKVTKEGVYLDDVKTEAKPIRIEVGEREVYVKPGEEVIIEVEGVSAKGKVELFYANKTLIAMNSKKPIRILPSEVSEKIGPVKEIRLVDEDEPKYRVSAERAGKILGLIPVLFDVEYEISAENGEILAKNKPWWTIFVFGESNPMPSPAPAKSSEEEVHEQQEGGEGAEEFSESPKKYNCTIPLGELDFPYYGDTPQQGLMTKEDKFVHKSVAVNIFSNNDIFDAGDFLGYFESSTLFFSLVNKTGFSPESLIKLAKNAELQCTFGKEEMSSNDIILLNAMGFDSLYMLSKIDNSDSEEINKIYIEALRYEMQKYAYAMGLSKRGDYVIPPEEKIKKWAEKAKEREPIIKTEKENEDVVIFGDGSTWQESDEDENAPGIESTYEEGCFKPVDIENNMITLEGQNVLLAKSIKMDKGEIAKVSIKIVAEPLDIKFPYLVVKISSTTKEDSIYLDVSETDHTFYFFNNQWCSSEPGVFCSISDNYKITITNIDDFNVEDIQICVEKVNSETIKLGKTQLYYSENPFHYFKFYIPKDNGLDLYIYNYPHYFYPKLPVIWLYGENVGNIYLEDTENYSISKMPPNSNGRWFILAGKIEFVRDVEEYINNENLLPIFKASEEIGGHTEIFFFSDVERKYYYIGTIPYSLLSEDSEPSEFWEGEIESYAETMLLDSEGNVIHSFGMSYPFFQYREAEDNGKKEYPLIRPYMPVTAFEIEDGKLYIPESVSEVSSFTVDYNVYEDDNKILEVLNPLNWFDIASSLITAYISYTKCIGALSLADCVGMVCDALDAVAEIAKVISADEDDNFGTAQIRLEAINYEEQLINETYLIEGADNGKEVDWYDYVAEAANVCSGIVDTVKMVSGGITDVTKLKDKLAEGDIEMKDIATLNKKYKSYEKTYKKTVNKFKWDVKGEGPSGRFHKEIYSVDEVSSIPIIEKIEVSIDSAHVLNDRDGDWSGMGDLYMWTFVGTVGGNYLNDLDEWSKGNLINTNELIFSSVDAWRIPWTGTTDVDTGSTWNIGEIILRKKAMNDDGEHLAGIYIEVTIFDDDTFEDDEVAVLSKWIPTEKIIENCKYDPSEKRCTYHAQEYIYTRLGINKDDWVEKGYPGAEIDYTIVLYLTKDL